MTISVNPNANLNIIKDFQDFIFYGGQGPGAMKNNERINA
jgi:hypothetical protein